jgi:hypothetical protein
MKALQLLNNTLQPARNYLVCHFRFHFISSPAIVIELALAELGPLPCALIPQEHKKKKANEACIRKRRSCFSVSKVGGQEGGNI